MRKKTETNQKQTTKNKSKVEKGYRPRGSQRMPPETPRRGKPSRGKPSAEKPNKDKKE